MILSMVQYTRWLVPIFFNFFIAGNQAIQFHGRLFAFACSRVNWMEKAWSYNSTKYFNFISPVNVNWTIRVYLTRTHTHTHTEIFTVQWRIGNAIRIRQLYRSPTSNIRLSLLQLSLFLSCHVWVNSWSNCSIDSGEFACKVLTQSYHVESRETSSMCQMDEQGI